MKKHFLKGMTALGFMVLMVLGAAGSVLAEETVSVNLERTTGGAIIASYKDGVSEVYLPIGEATAVPKGKQVRVWTTSNGFKQQNGRLARTYLNVNGENVSDERGMNTYVFSATEDTSIAAGFITEARQDDYKPNEYAMELSYWTESNSAEERLFFKYQADTGVMNQRLALYFNEVRVDFSQAQTSITDVYASGIGRTDKECNPGLFTLSADGVLSSKEALSYGTYEFGISVSYGGVEEDLYIGYTVGIAGECTFPIYEISYNGHTRYGMSNVITYNLNSASTVGELVNAYHSSYNRKLAGYDIVGWKNPENGTALADHTPISSIIQEDGYVNICPIFQSKADGHVYQVVLQ